MTVEREVFLDYQDANSDKFYHLWIERLDRNRFNLMCRYGRRNIGWMTNRSIGRTRILENNVNIFRARGKFRYKRNEKVRKGYNVVEENTLPEVPPAKKNTKKKTEKSTPEPQVRNRFTNLVLD